MYELMIRQTESLLACCPPPLSAMSNCAALLWHTLPKINWAGFYLLRNDALYLGPFQGKPACMVIPIEHGVCGTATATGQVQRVADVHQFSGHIACDSASQSEIVLPMVKDGILYGVMDIDSPVTDRFDAQDEAGLISICNILMEKIHWKDGLLG